MKKTTKEKEDKWYEYVFYSAVCLFAVIGLIWFSLYSVPKVWWYFVEVPQMAHEKEGTPKSRFNKRCVISGDIVQVEKGGDGQVDGWYHIPCV